MKKAILITGFNNWGKTRIINHANLFNGRNYKWGQTCRINGINSEFIVENHSNDDYVGKNWIKQLQARIKEVEKNQHNENWNLFTALCPSLENNNNFIHLLNDEMFADYEKHLFLIKYKWENHAELIIKNIQSKLHLIPNASSYVIDQDANIANPDDRTDAKTLAIYNILRTIFP
ncbi:hypothetical protein [Chryseolinea soli]|uniref:G domain-containing protein n=1 Tax=Chryseolinea soli TaxID=2321403 RepID=A0A385SKB8_9BACT|nr:hypothetical protein [Chryseolinea soli]AYB29448.1 hypothetical protein D4L85_02110 [Chryseolinea soli]